MMTQSLLLFLMLLVRTLLRPVAAAMLTDDNDVKLRNPITEEDRSRFSDRLKHIDRTSATEKDISMLEEIRLKAVAEILEKRNISVHGFYHMNPTQSYWRSILAEQLQLLDGYHIVRLWKDMADHAEVDTDHISEDRHMRLYKQVVGDQYKYSREHEFKTDGLISITNRLFIGLNAKYEMQPEVINFIKSVSPSYMDKIDILVNNFTTRDR